MVKYPTNRSEDLLEDESTQIVSATERPVVKQPEIALTEPQKYNKENASRMAQDRESAAAQLPWHEALVALQNLDEALTEEGVDLAKTFKTFRRARRLVRELRRFEATAAIHDPIIDQQLRRYENRLTATQKELYEKANLPFFEDLEQVASERPEKESLAVLGQEAKTLKVVFHELTTNTIRERLEALIGAVRLIPLGSLERERIFGQAEDLRRRLARRLYEETVKEQGLNKATPETKPFETIQQPPVHNQVIVGLEQLWAAKAHTTPKPIIREPRTTPIAQEKTTPKTQEESWFSKGLESTKKGLDYVLSFGKNKTSEFLATQFMGELSPVERGERQLTKIEAATRMAGALASAAGTMYGVMLPVDAARYLSQRHFTRQERESIQSALEAAAKERVASPDQVGTQATLLQERILSSKYLTPDKRAELLKKCQAVINNYSTESKKIDQEFAKEAGELLGEAIQTRISGAKVMKESVNTALMLSGLNVLRGGAYGAIALADRWSTFTKDNVKERSYARVKQFVMEGFNEWSSKLAGYKGRTWSERRLNQIEALGTLARAAGLVQVSFANLPGPAVHEQLEKIFFAFEAQSTPEVTNVVVPPPVEVITPETVSVPVEISEVTEAGQTGEPEVIQTPELSDEFPPVETVPIPPSAIVQKEDSISGIIARMIEKNPQAFGYSGGNDELLEKKFAFFKAADAVTKLGLFKPGELDTWLTPEAIGHLAIIPEHHGDQLEVTFADSITGERLKVEDLAARGYTVEK